MLKLKEKYEIVEKLSKKHSKRKLLRILEVSRSSYYYNQKEKKNQREIENEILLEQITLIWQKSHKRYGSKKVVLNLGTSPANESLMRNGTLTREWRGTDSQGKFWRGYYENGIVTSFFPE